MIVPGASAREKEDAGASYVLFGSRSGWNASVSLHDGLVLNGVAAHDRSGTAVSGALNANGDGIDDPIIGAPEADRGEIFAPGKSSVAFGSTSLDDNTPSEAIADTATTRKNTPITINVLAKDCSRWRSDLTHGLYPTQQRYCQT